MCGNVICYDCFVYYHIATEVCHGVESPILMCIIVHWSIGGRGSFYDIDIQSIPPAHIYLGYHTKLPAPFDLA